jgi:single-strand DNA-binding protein
MNKVQLIGNVGNDPEVRTLQNGSKVCNFSVATSDRWKDKTTVERKERTEWHRIVIFNTHLVDVAEKYIGKGSKVYIEGQLTTRKWQDDQKKDQYTTEIVLKQFHGEIELLDKKPEADQGNDSAAISEDDIPL